MYIKNYTNEAEFKRIFRQVGISLCWLCLVILAGLIVVRRWVVCIFDSAYYDSMLIAPALVCGACFDLLTCIYSIGINIKKENTVSYHNSVCSTSYINGDVVYWAA